MDQLGNTEPITEEPGSEDHQPDVPAGQAEVSCTLAVFRADLGVGEADIDAGTAEPAADAAPADAATAEPAADAAEPSCDRVYPDGFTGVLALQNLEAFNEDMAGEALGRVAHLISWAQAQQARLMDRMEELFRDRFHAASSRVESGMAFSVAASECAAILNVPQVTAQRMMFEAGSLCSIHTSTLASLEEGRFSYAHAQVVLDQCQNVPPAALPEFEASLLEVAEGQTRAQFSAKARRLREKQYPETISKRHQSAFEQRKVTLDREEDGMSCLSAHLRAEEAQQIYTTLTTAARGEQADGDPRTADQLRADILAQLLMGGFSSARAGGLGSPRAGGVGSPRADGVNGGDVMDDGHDAAPTGTTICDEAGVVPRAEIMVLINAETLFGADDRLAELQGYGPISADAARRLARNAAGWTGLAQDPRTGEILGVGRRRKVPAGLRRWLRARDGTCRFPGCRVSTASSDIDHTIDWAKGGPTDHGNLEHLCRRHHRFKTLGYWKACQPTPGVIEWTSPTGRVYRTEPFLELDSAAAASSRGMDATRAKQKEPAVKESLQERVPPF